jgi:hypothetical protein
MAELIAFPVQIIPPSLVDLVRKTRELALKSENFYLNPRAKTEMHLGGVVMRDLLEVLRQGEGVGGPDLDDYGYWRIKLARYTAGRKVQLVVVLKKDKLEVLTVTVKLR